MSTETQKLTQPSTPADWMGATDEGRSEEGAVENQVFLPFAQIHNDRNNYGRAGGLFIQQETIDESMTDVVIDQTIFQPVSLPFEKADNTIEDAPGFISQDFHFGLVAFDHNSKGYAKCWEDMRRKNEKTGKGKWTLTVIALIKEADSRLLPVKINFRGPSAIRMANHINAFAQFVVGRVTTEKRKKFGKQAPSASRNQFWLPVSLRGEKVGSGSESSWTCPVQDMLPGWKFEVKDGKRSVNGTSVLAKYDTDPNSIYDLFIGKDEAGKKIVEQLKEWTTEFAASVKTFTKDGGATGGGADQIQTGADFLGEGPGDAISEPQAGLLGDLNADLPDDADVEFQLQVCRETGVLVGGTPGCTIMNLTKKGASALISYVKPLAKAAKQAKKDKAGEAPALEDSMLPGGLLDDGQTNDEPEDTVVF